MIKWLLDCQIFSALIKSTDFSFFFPKIEEFYIIWNLYLFLRKLLFTESLLCTRAFAYVNFYTHSKPNISPFYRWREWGPLWSSFLSMFFVSAQPGLTLSNSWVCSHKHSPDRHCFRGWRTAFGTTTKVPVWSMSCAGEQHHRAEPASSGHWGEADRRAPEELSSPLCYMLGFCFIWKGLYLKRSLLNMLKE